MNSQNRNWDRPKKLRYFPIKESSSALPKQKVTIRDIEHLFDDLDSASEGENGLLPLSPLPKTLHEESEVLNGQIMLSMGRLEGRMLETEIESSFKELQPIRTSSPIDWKVHAEKRDDDGERSASPLLFDCDEPKDHPASNQNPDCNGLPKDRTEKRPPPAPHMRQEPQCSALVQDLRPKELTMDKSKQKPKDKSAFLLKLNEAGPPKLPWTPQSPLKSTPPEPDYDFLILEDIPPCRFAIPRKAAPNKSKNTPYTKAPNLGRDVSKDVGAQQSKLEKLKARQKQPRTSAEAAPDKGKISMDVGVTEEPPLTTATSKESFGKKTKRDTSLAKVTRPEVEEDVISCLDYPFANHMTKPGQQNYDTNKLDKDLLKASTYVKKGEKQPVDGASATPAKLESTIGTEKKTRKLPKGRISKAVDSGGKYSKKSRAKFDQPVNGNGDEVLGLETLDDSKPLENMEKLITDEHETDLFPYTQNQSVIPETPTNKKRPRRQQKTTSLDPGFNKNPVKKTLLASELNSSQEGQQSLKRQRKKPGAWWLSCPVVSELNNDPMDAVTPGSDKEMTVKKSKLNRTKKVLRLQTPSAPTCTQEHVKTPEPSQQRRPVSSDCWNLNAGTENTQSYFSPVYRRGTKKRRTYQRKERRPLPPQSLLLKNGNMATTSRPVYDSPQKPLNKEDVSLCKTVEGSLAAFSGIFSSGQKASAKRIRGKGACKRLCPSLQQQSAHGDINDCTAEEPDLEPDSNAIGDNISAVNRGSSSVYAESPAKSLKKPSRPSYGSEGFRGNERLSNNTLKGFKSGPSSMMENYEENEDLCLPLPQEVEGVWSNLDLCGPPLRPLVLQVQDKANMSEWLGLLWPPNIQDGGHVTPDQFQWYSYKSRAMGFHVDLHCETFCNGKILLGSLMKKPLLVDHKATSVFNVLTSCVCVTINGKKTNLNPGQSFLVPCGHAYSLHNMTQEPAVLYFNRMLAECTD